MYTQRIKTAAKINEEINRYKLKYKYKQCKKNTKFDSFKRPIKLTRGKEKQWGGGENLLIIRNEKSSH